MRDAIKLINKTFSIDNKIYRIKDICLVEETERIYINSIDISSEYYLEINFPLETVLKHLKK